MANEIKSQLKLKAAEDFLVLYPETSADIVYTAVDGITATNVEDAVAELYGLIQAITNGGVVTGIKQPGDEGYKQGNIDITPDTLGLGNVDNTADADKPVSTATQEAIEEAVADALSGAKEYADVVDLNINKEDAVYKYTFTFTKADGTTTTTVIDLPLEEMILSCEYDKETKKLKIELATGEELEIDIDDIIGGLVNQSEYDEKVAELEEKIETINTAEGNVEEAVKTAQAAADAAQEAAETAQAAADTAEGHVTEVKAQAEQAQTDATQALTDAATAQSAAEAAQGTADEAKETAEATKTALEDTDIAGTYSAVGVNEAGVVVAGQNIVEYWEDGEEPADSNLAIGGIAIVPIKE
ncbi:MAG: hypothetical protein LUD47_07510 [Clostridia bacterium]|nr:hypothetical protein [Clostridia bacterium]